LTSTDLVSVKDIRISNDGTWDTEPWEAVVANKSWTLLVGDGMKIVYYQVRNTANATSIVYSDTILLDTSEPFTTISYTPAFAPTWVTAATLFTLSATDGTGSGVASIRYRLNGGSWTTYSGAFTVSSQANGNVLIEFNSTDNAGNVESMDSTTVVLDKTDPGGSIAINNGSSFTNTTSVTLTLTFTDAGSGIDQVRYSNDGVFDTEPWEAAVATKSWSLFAGDGTKTVQYQVRDNAGLTSTFSDAIVPSMRRAYPLL
jgi:hypothetical protein